jgi:sugar lactone lactonase YvrE
MGNNGGVLATSLFGRSTPHSDGTRLFVADTRNHRVLVWNAIPTTNGKNADVVLGQPNMTSNTQNNGGVSAVSLFSPSFVYVAGGRLFVSDAGNSRVLIWNSIPSTDRAPADVVLGQADMMTADTALPTSSKSIKNPDHIHVDANGRLYISDPGSHRILYWNAVPTQNQPPADGVIGQPNMDVALANNGGLNARTLQQPGGTLSNGTLLYILDSGNDRMLLLPRP